MMGIRKFIRDDGSARIDGWLQGIKDSRAKARIFVRLNRIKLGLLGDCKSVGEGVHELRIAEGAGYRVYFGLQGRKAILLLCGGDKSTQQKAIQLAKAYWKSFKVGLKND